MWSNKKYNEKREADLKKWRIGEYAGSSLNKREPEIMEGAKSKRRRQYMIVEEDWGMGENPQKTVHEEEPIGTERSTCTEKHREPQTAAVLDDQRTALSAKVQTKLSDFWPTSVLETAPPTVTREEAIVLDLDPVPETTMRAAPSTTLPTEEVEERTVRDEQYSIDEKGCLEENVKTFASSTTPVLWEGSWV